jgi:hypothetical protein
VIGEGRFSRQEALFGAHGQQLLAATRVGIVGLGGLGSFVAMELAYAGVRELLLLDHDSVGLSNLNRLVGAVPGDAQRDVHKTDVAARMVAAIAPNVTVTGMPDPFEQPAARAALAGADVVFSCVDNDPVRLAIMAFCCERGIQFFDLASDTGSDDHGVWYGGRVLFSGEGERCPSCMDLLDQRALARASMSESQRAEDARIYGITAGALVGSGPSVVSINGVVASLAVSEFVKWRTGLGLPAGLLTYRGDLGVVLRAVDDHSHECFYCSGWGSTRRMLAAIG